MTEYEYRIQDPVHPNQTLDNLVMDKETVDVAVKGWYKSHPFCGVYVESRPVVHWTRVE